jgi:hypothetical protein
LSAFSFDSQQKTLSFQVSGPQNTCGYVDLYIPKTLLSDASSLTVNLDGNPVVYTTQSAGDSWLICFTYHHSSHSITVDLNASKTETTLDLLNQWVAWIAIGSGLAAIVVAVLVVVLILRKKSPAVSGC